MTTLTPPAENENETRTLIDVLLAEQRDLTAVERFAGWHDSRNGHSRSNGHYKNLIPLTAPKRGEQFAFEVDLDKCSGCKACVTACHSLNGLDESETWRGVGLLIGDSRITHHASRAADSSPRPAFQQHITTACHHCADPGCMNGCPVLAYDKDPVTGIVRHLDDQCIGCQYCVMKCPYEVPKYSSRLGIVRKCDMCANRLAVGEAPACVQACPSEAIKITVVETKSAIGDRRSAINVFLPDSPDPRITLPTTRYISKKSLPELFAADHDTPRLDQSHWPLVIMLVLTQAAAGMFLAVPLVAGKISSTLPMTLVGFGLLAIGLVSATLHLGQPLKAWRSFLGWRKSWLSRELIAFNAFAGAAVLSILYPPSSILSVTVGLIAVFTSAMVYVDTGRAFWSPRIVFVKFLATTLLLGSIFTAVALGGLSEPGLAKPFVAAALVIRAAHFIWWRLELRSALNNAASPIHMNARAIRELLPWTQPARTFLFVASSACGIFVLANFPAALMWAIFAALFTFTSEIIGRYVFFAASASKRMPGGIAA